MSHGGSNHKPAFVTPLIALGSAAAAGVLPETIRADSTIQAFDTTAPTTQAFGDAAAVGTAAFAARRDHKHAWPAGVVLANLPLIKEQAGTSTASASSVTLPTDGNQIPITGTTTINTLVLTGNTGRQATLRFASAACRVASSDRGSGGNILLHGPFSSLASGTLTLFCDGTNWYEIARSGYRLPTVLITRTTTLALSVGYNNVPFTAETEDAYSLFAATSTTVTITSETAGLWLIKGTAIYDTAATADRVLYFTINGSLYEIGGQPASTVANPAFSGVKIIRLANAGTVVLTAYSGAASNLIVGASTNAAELEMRWLEP